MQKSLPENFYISKALESICTIYRLSLSVIALILVIQNVCKSERNRKSPLPTFAQSMLAKLLQMIKKCQINPAQTGNNYVLKLEFSLYPILPVFRCSALRQKN
jgi:hypothetical protein